MKTMNKANNAKPIKKYCYFCTNAIKEVDYKNIQIIQKFLSSYGKIAPRQRSGVCSPHQRQLAQAVKRARYLSLLPYTSK
ncbi:MAG: 30S ribosomal protein S18 [Candidatus Komeilibacteria bacterium CG_4_10_14_0_2_um_filter_37_10]|uniref:Small ribosomal subunit protein bS18 n=1 Tax=Candidatus Komeilibacteria bacterium CG_4_10_14_0_2_um_filter_37_10 TaxID=1974470 RepID=A0A2M7VEX9_9BACT|nr:MAG: 30S ribosomal protein S18 [Candidatus Komeilibacteria bacterium CG_4_10_14_0_2_um_filter_37_10]